MVTVLETVALCMEKKKRLFIVYRELFICYLIHLIILYFFH